MDWEEAKEMYRISDRRIAETDCAWHRSLYGLIDWRNRLIGVKGPRGVGKTTMLLQHLRESFGDSGKALYVSLDNLWFAAHDLHALADYHYTHGGEVLVVDEVHYAEEWQRRIKNLYDDFPKLSIVYTGSSMLKIDFDSGDLSRRQALYAMQGLSFREYLSLEGLAQIPPVALGDLLSRHVAIARDLASRIRVLGAFDAYLRRGYYPFYRESGDGYGDRIRRMAVQVLESDWPAVEEVTPATVRKARKMLMVLAEQPPQTPNLSRLAAELEVDRKQCIRMLHMLERAGLLALLGSGSDDLKNLSRPDKIYCDNPNLMAALVPETDAGTLRECFFVNQVRVGRTLAYPPAGDVLVDGKWLFEIGGRKKGFGQIKDLPGSYLAVADTEIGRGSRIPIWMFGLLD